MVVENKKVFKNISEPIEDAIFHGLNMKINAKKTKVLVWAIIIERKFIYDETNTRRTSKRVHMLGGYCKYNREKKHKIITRVG